MNLKRFVTSTFSLLTLGVVSLSLNAAAENGKHLFILSGQSNMARLNEKVSFVPTIEKKFGKENVVIVRDAHGGQAIQRWYRQWKGRAGKTENGDLYDCLMKIVKPVWFHRSADVHHAALR